MAPPVSGFLVHSALPFNAGAGAKLRASCHWSGSASAARVCRLGLRLSAKIGKEKQRDGSTLPLCPPGGDGDCRVSCLAGLGPEPGRALTRARLRCLPAGGPAQLRSNAPGADRRHRRGVAQEGRPMALAAHRARRSRPEARARGRGRHRLRYRVPRARPHVTRQRHAVLAAVACARQPQGGGQEASLQRSEICRSDRQGACRARLHRFAEQQVAAGNKGRLFLWRRRPAALRALLPWRRGKLERAARPGARRGRAELDSGVRPDHPPHAHRGARSAIRSTPRLPPTCSALPKARPPTSSNLPARAAREPSARRPASSKSASATSRSRPKPTAKCGFASRRSPRSAISPPGKC